MQDEFDWCSWEEIYKAMGIEVYPQENADAPA
jgi:hypothetical protein